MLRVTLLRRWVITGMSSIQRLEFNLIGQPCPNVIILDVSVVFLQIVVFLENVRKSSPKSVLLTLVADRDVIGAVPFRIEPANCCHYQILFLF
jgi:hypothetical protein